MNSETAKNLNTKKSFFQFLPWWMWIVVGLQFGLVSFYIAATAMDPMALLPGDQKLDYLVVLYVTRNATALLGILVALLIRSHSALLVALIIRFSTDSTDIVNALTLGDKGAQAGIPFVIVLLIIPAISGSIYLWKRIQEDKRA